MKLKETNTALLIKRSPPHTGGRGLKLNGTMIYPLAGVAPSHGGARIETYRRRRRYLLQRRPLTRGGAD